VFRSIEDADGDELLIHPSHRKYDESRRMPYFVMIDRLRAFLRANQKPVALFVIGYSFGDDHLNEAIVEGLAANPSAACFALQYGVLGDYPSAKKLALENANLSVLARDAAIVRLLRRNGLRIPLRTWRRSDAPSSQWMTQGRTRRTRMLTSPSGAA
jgi:hypothetical protein